MVGSSEGLQRVVAFQGKVEEVLEELNVEVGDVEEREEDPDIPRNEDVEGREEVEELDEVGKIPEETREEENDEEEKEVDEEALERVGTEEGGGAIHHLEFSHREVLVLWKEQRVLPRYKGVVIQISDFVGSLESESELLSSKERRPELERDEQGRDRHSL